MKELSEKAESVLDDVVALFENMDMDERMSFLYALGDYYCKYCGSKWLPCYCTCDD